jgi:NADH-quinone oxidoreductase subunit K
MRPGPDKALLISGVFMALGLLGLVLRTHVIALLLSVELLLAAGNLALVALVPSPAGRAAALLVLAVAASEAAVGLALCVAIKRSRGSLDPESFKEMKG